jgi:hypothetical protein
MRCEYGQNIKLTSLLDGQNKNQFLAKKPGK